MFGGNDRIINAGKGWKKDTIEFQRASKERDKCKYYCSCGHSTIIPYQLDKKQCTWCGKILYKEKIDKQRFFKDKMRQLLNQKNREGEKENGKNNNGR